MAGPRVGCLRAGAAIEAAHLTAQVHIVLAVSSTVPNRAGAAVCVQAISAGGSIFTRLRITLVLLILTKGPIKTRTATAREGVYVINTCPII